MGRVCYRPSLLCAEFVWAEFVMCRVYYGPSLLCAELTRYFIFNLVISYPVWSFRTQFGHFVPTSIIF